MIFRRTTSGFGHVHRRRYAILAALVAGLWFTESCKSATDAGPPPVATVLVSATTSQLIVGQTHQMSLRLEDADGNVLTNRATVWSTTNSTVASVSSAGLVQALSPGSVQIVATSEKVNGSATFGIIPAVSAVTVEPSLSTVFRGTTHQLTATPRDNNGTPLTQRTITWTSSNVAVATVTEAGLVQAVGAGSVQISAISEGRTGLVSLTVLEPVAQVTVDPSVATVRAGDGVQLIATPRDAVGTALSERLITFSSANTAVARVSPEGLVTGVAEGGPVVITATSEGKSGTASITVTPHPCDIEVPITLPDTLNGALQTVDCRLNDGTYIDFYKFTLSATTDVLIELNSTAFDAWLYLLTTDYFIIDTDDDSGVGTNSRMRIRLGAGTYVIGANSYFAGESGAYSVSLIVDPNAAMCAVHPSVAVGDTVAGTIANTDCIIFGSFFADRWRLELTEERALRFQVTSSTMQPFVLVADTTGLVIALDETGAGGNTFTLKADLGAGKYDVWATTWWSEAIGDYTLAVTPEPPWCTVSSALTLGQTVNGTLAAGDCALNDSTFADAWRIVVTESTPIQLDLSSPDFDTYLVLTDRYGKVLATDDDGGPGSSSRVETTLCCGEYLVWANSYAPGGRGTYTLSAVQPPPAAVNLVVDGAYLVQSTQRYDGTVPLVAGRSAVVRVFGRASLNSAITPSVRVRFHDAGALVETMTLAMDTGSIRTFIDEGTRFGSWSAVVPAARVKSGLSFTVEIDPDGLVTESDETDNTWPQDGQPRAVDVRSVPPLTLTFVPVRHQASGLVGDVSTSNLSTYTDLTRRLFPLGTVNAFVRAPYTTTLAAVNNVDSWVRLLGELEAIRVAENPTHHYYGVVNTNAAGGPIGISNGIPARTAASIDAPNARSAVAHELGHNFGRYHSPCGGPGGPDPQYPYANGGVGVYGYDPITQTVIRKSAKDVMGYCEPWWISDYTFLGVLKYRASSSAAPPPPQSVMLVWGTIVDGKPAIEPAFRLVAPPLLPSRTGDWLVQLRDASGGIIASHPFTPTEIHDGERPGMSFTFALPLDSADAERVASIAVIGPTGRAEITQSHLARGQVMSADSRPALRRATGNLTVGWSTDRYPMAMVRDAQTGRILSLVRGGQFTVPAGSAKLDVLWSDGVRTHREQVAP